MRRTLLALALLPLFARTCPPFVAAKCTRGCAPEPEAPGVWGRSCILNGIDVALVWPMRWACTGGSGRGRTFMVVVL